MSCHRSFHFIVPVNDIDIGLRLCLIDHANEAACFVNETILTPNISLISEESHRTGHSVVDSHLIVAEGAYEELLADVDLEVDQFPKALRLRSDLPDLLVLLQSVLMETLLVDQ